MAEKESKKRKRQSVGTETPSKKVAIETPGSVGGKIKVSYVEETGLHPVLVSAPGVNAPRVPFKAYSKPTSTKHENGAVKPKTHDLLLQSSQHPRLDHTAAPSPLDQHLSHHVAVFDPATNQLQVTPAHHLSLRSTLRSEAQDEEQDRLSYAKQREELGREFGTKKAKKAIADKTVNAITQDPKGKGKVTDVQSAILESVGDATAGAAKKNAEQEADALLASKPIPKPNIHAETVEDVYTFNELIPPSDARLIPIKDWQDKTRADEKFTLNHRFPASRVEAIGKGDDSLKLKALRYLALLLDFHDVLSKGGRDGKKVPKKDVLSKRLSEWPGQLVDSVRRRFTTDSGNELGKWQMDNLYTHMCALSLYIDGWVTDTTDLKDDLRMEARQIQQYFNELGAKVSAPTESEKAARNLKKAQAAVTRLAKLKLPLEFPKPRTARRR